MNSKFYKSCAVPMCKSTTITTPDKLFIYIPRNKQIRRKWLRLAGRETAAFGTTTSAYFCEDHFDLQNDMENYVEYTTMGKVSRIIMKPGCLPTKFACQPATASASLDFCQPAMVKRNKLVLIKKCEKEREIRVGVSLNCETLSHVPSTSSGEPVTTTIDQLPQAIETIGNLDDGVSVEIPIIKCEPNEDYNFQNIGEPSTSTIDNRPPATETIDNHDGGAYGFEVPIIKCEPNEDYNFKNIVTPKEDSLQKVEDVKLVVKSEMCAEHIRFTNNTSNGSIASSGHTTLAFKEISNETKYWKSKLTQILHSTKFCGVCLSTDDDMNSVYDRFEIVVCEQSHAATLADILRVVFAETEDLLANSQICNKCTSKLIQSYMFIQQARETSKILNCHVNDLYNKSCYIRNNYLKETNLEQNKTQNVVISLDNYDKVDRLYNIHTNEQTKKVENTLDRFKRKPKFKCLRCNLHLPSYKAWTLHEVSIHHRNKKCYRPQPNISRSNARGSKKICRTCHRIIEAGGFVEHMKKYHGQLRLCSICNITFSSFEDFVSHKHEWHYKADRNCLTCLGSFSELGLEQHQCRFGCDSCAEVPCVHHKYLMCYREQVLNGKLTPKCLDCYYVSRNKEAMLKHVNLCHLKLRPKVS